MYALRARLLNGLGAQKRAIVDVDAALVLFPGDAELLKCKQDRCARKHWDPLGSQPVRSMSLGFDDLLQPPSKKCSHVSVGACHVLRGSCQV